MKRFFAALLCGAVMATGFAPAALPQDTQAPAARPGQTSAPRAAEKTPEPSQRAARENRAGAVMGKGRAEAGRGHAEPNKISTPFSDSLPELNEKQREIRRNAMRINNPKDLPVPVGEPVTGGAQRDEPETAVPSAATQPKAASQAEAAPQAATDYKDQRFHSMTSSEVPTTQRSSTNEPSVANIGQAVFFTGNWYGARSVNGGKSFSYVSPYAAFPSVNGGFCCDQVINSTPYQNAQGQTDHMLLWLLQYVKDASTGTLRLAVLPSAATGLAQASPAWTYYDFTPQNMGFAAGNWFDYPSITVGSTYVYLTSNVFTTSANTYTGSVIWRVPISQLAAGGGVTFEYYTTPSTVRATEGATTTMYFGSWVTTTQFRIHNWADGSPTVNFFNVNPQSFVYMSNNGNAIGPDATNWAARADSRPLGGWIANGVVGFAWMAKEDATHPYPYSIIGRFNATTGALVSQHPIYSTTTAFLYPNVTTNARGDVGGLIFYGGGSLHPTTATFIVDDVTNNFSSLALNSPVASTHGPSSNRWGDYHTVRRHKDYPNSFVAGTFTLNGGGTGSSAIPAYRWFGRERDLPSACTYTLTPASATVGSAAGSGSFTVTTQADCTYTVTSSAGWLTHGGGGTGSGTVNYDYAQNAGPGSRGATLTISGSYDGDGTPQNFTLTQNAPPVVTTLAPSADAYVKGATPDTNYGTVTELQVKRTFTPGNGKGRQAYFRFDTSSVGGTITKATLRVWGNLNAVTAANVNIPLAVFPVSAAWGELTLTWNNKPAPNVPSELARVTVPDATPRWYEFDVTAFIQQERAAGRPLTGVLLRNMLRGEVGDYYTAVNSREAASNQPQLVIEH